MANAKRKTYIVIGGSPFTNYTGTTTFTGLYEIGRYKSKRAADEAVRSNYESAGGLLLIIEV